MRALACMRDVGLGCHTRYVIYNLTMCFDTWLEHSDVTMMGSLSLMILVMCMECGGLGLPQTKTPRHFSGDRGYTGVANVQTCCATHVNQRMNMFISIETKIKGINVRMYGINKC